MRHFNKHSSLEWSKAGPINANVTAKLAERASTPGLTKPSEMKCIRVCLGQALTDEPVHLPVQSSRLWLAIEAQVVPAVSVCFTIATLAFMGRVQAAVGGNAFERETGSVTVHLR